MQIDTSGVTGSWTAVRLKSNCRGGGNFLKLSSTLGSLLSKRKKGPRWAPPALDLFAGISKRVIARQHPLSIHPALCPSRQSCRMTKCCPLCYILIGGSPMNWVSIPRPRLFKLFKDHVPLTFMYGPAGKSIIIISRKEEY